jgi:hypothetical protein
LSNRISTKYSVLATQAIPNASMIEMTEFTTDQTLKLVDDDGDGDGDGDDAAAA